MADKHYEWAVLTSDGSNWSGLYSMGPSSAEDVLWRGEFTYERDPETGDDVYDERGERVVKSVRIAPEGSYVARRIVSRGEWEPADDKLWPGQK